MDFRIADTFTESLSRLTGDEQKAVKTTAFDLQMNPANPGLSFHKLDKAKDKNFWSVRVNLDVRIIVHRTVRSLLLCYVDHHDKAYDWAERRKLEIHPSTGAAQLVKVRETVKEVFVPVYVEAPVTKAKAKTVTEAASSKPMFLSVSDNELLGYGVPPEWLPDVRGATEDLLLQLVEHLPAEASEALLELATGGKPRTGETKPKDPFDHPDAQRRFRIMSNLEELERALEFPWDKWTVFLHPDQRESVDRDYAGPARISGSAGTGKTIVALHRAVYLAKQHGDARVLVSTYSDPLANALHNRLKRLIGNEPRLAERIDVSSLPTLGLRLYRAHVGPATLASRDVVRGAVLDAGQVISGHKFASSFLLAEWDYVVDAWGLDSWEAYRDVARLGRKTRIPETQRVVLWSIFDRARSVLRAKNTITEAGLFCSLAKAIEQSNKVLFDYAIVDEAQDLGVAHVRFFAALGGNRHNNLFFTGDLGQRIFQHPFSWKALGVDIRGRSRNLRVNYRTSHQIRTQADRLLGPSASDADGNTEKRTDTVSVFNGPTPTVSSFTNQAEEVTVAAQWLRKRIAEGAAAHELAIFVRSDAQIDRAKATATSAGLPFKVLDDQVETTSGKAAIATMHLAKGLEFRAVAVLGCDDQVVPLQARIDAVGDTGDLEEAYETERNLLYVACTRARDHLFVSGVKPASEFLDDFAAPS